VDDDTDDTRARGPEARRAAIVDIADGARMLLDALARLVGDKRRIAKRQRYRGRRYFQRIGDRGQLDLLGQNPSPGKTTFKQFKAAYAIKKGLAKEARSKLFRR
jgi:hypothetical protein